MAKAPTRGLEPAPGSLTHNPFASLKGRAASRPNPAPPVIAKQAAPRPLMVRVRLETKGRSGKVVTRIAGLPRENLTAIAARITQALGCLATSDDGDVLLEGSLKERATEWLERAGDLRAIKEAPKKPVAVESAPARAASLGDGTKRADIRPGYRVAIVLKEDQPTGKLTYGVVRELLTSSPTHPRGVKVRLESGEVGRVKDIFG